MPSPHWPRERTVSEALDPQGCVVVHSLEYTVIYQCTNRCRACNHFTFIQPEHAISIEQFTEDLEAVSSFAHCDKFSLIGGECLLHPNIVQLLDVVNRVGIGDLVSLTSNGQLIDKFGDELWSRLQRIEFGLYSGKGWTVEKMRWLMGLVKKWNLPAFFGLVGQHPSEVVDFVAGQVSSNERWSHSVNPGFHPTMTSDVAKEGEAQRRFAHCLYGHVCTTIDRGFLFRCPESSFVPGLLLNTDSTLDGVCIADMNAAKFKAFVEREDHLHSCHRCCSLEHYFPWSEVAPETTREEWLALAVGD